MNTLALCILVTAGGRVKAKHTERASGAARLAARIQPCEPAPTAANSLKARYTVGTAAARANRKHIGSAKQEDY